MSQNNEVDTAQQIICWVELQLTQPFPLSLSTILQMSGDFGDQAMNIFETEV